MRVTNGQAVEWWEKAAGEAMDLGVDPAQALRLYKKADSAAQALQSRVQHHMADSALSLGQLMDSSRAAESFNKASRQALFDHMTASLPDYHITGASILDLKIQQEWQ